MKTLEAGGYGYGRTEILEGSNNDSEDLRMSRTLKPSHLYSKTPLKLASGLQNELSPFTKHVMKE
jgi:hypothetical protein